jgi:hypothetical protein
VPHVSGILSSPVRYSPIFSWSVRS